MGKLGALDGITVVDLSRVLAGPYCTQLLADHGANVIKVEPPNGDDTRRWGPPFNRDGTAAYFDGVNRNKSDVVIDLRTDEGRDSLLTLLETADVLVENYKSGTLARWGLGYDDVLAARFPRLVYCSITGFGDDGPLGGLPGYDSIMQAGCGLMSVNGDAGGPPLRVGLPAVDMVTGLNAANGILMALHERTASGRGQRVEIALYDVALSFMHPHMISYLTSGEQPVRTGNSHPNIAPYSTFPTRTVPIFLAVGNDTQFANLCRYIEVPTLLADARFTDNGARCVHRAELRRELEPALGRFDGATLADDLIRHGVPCSIIRDVAQVAAHPHTEHRHMLVTVGGYRGVASPIKLSRTPATYRRAPPTFGCDTQRLIPDPAGQGSSAGRRE